MSGNAIQECIALVTTGIPHDFKAGESTIVRANPSQVAEWRVVALWGQHLGEGDTTIVPRMPAILAFLRKLADNGVGHAGEHNGIRYKFLKNNDSGTTTPISSL